MMIGRIVLVLALFSLSQPSMAQGFDYSHPLFQSEFKTWNYDKLFDCSIRYEIVIGVFETLADDPSEITTSTLQIEQAYKALFGYALMAGTAQGVSSFKLHEIHAQKVSDVLAQLGEYRASSKKEMYEVLAEYMTYAKFSCRPYFEALDVRMRDIEERYLAAP